MTICSSFRDFISNNILKCVFILNNLLKHSQRLTARAEVAATWLCFRLFQIFHIFRCFLLLQKCVKLQEDLIDVMPAVEEANSISEELDKRVKFEIILIRLFFMFCYCLLFLLLCFIVFYWTRGSSLRSSSSGWFFLFLITLVDLPN